MADGVNFKLDGFDDLKKRLDAFTNPASLRRISTRATRAGLKNTRKKVRENAKRIDDPKTAENIARNVATKVNSKKFRYDGTITGSVGISGGAKKGGGGKGGDTYYWRFIEFGTSKMAAKPFVRPAMDTNEMTEAFRRALSESIDKEIQKYGAP